MDSVSCTTPLFLEKAAGRAAAFFGRYRTAFLSSLFFGFLAYGFVFTNKLINHDEAHSLFIKGATVVSGRWGLGALDTVFPNYSMPWIYGLITVFLVAVGICILVSMFEIRNRVLQGILAGCVMVFPSLIGLFGYMFTSCSFALSFLLSILSAAALQTEKKRYIPIAAGCLVLSLSIYQSYISVAAGLLVLVLMRRLLTGRKVSDVLKQGIFYVLFLVVCLVAYYLCTQVVFRITGTGMGDYASGNFTFTPGGILSGGVLAYKTFFRFFTEGASGLIPTAFSRTLHGIALVITLFLAAGLCKTGKLTDGAVALLAALTAVLPLAINCMYMITAEDSIHTLVLYGFVNLYIWMLMLAQLTLEAAEKCTPSGLLLNAQTCLLALVIAGNIYIANEASLHLYLRYENAYAFYTSLAADIKLQPEFTEETALAVIGNYQQPAYYTEQFEHIHAITGVYGFVPDNYSNQRFLEYYLGFSIPFATQEEIAAIQASPEFEAMPVYPYYGSLGNFGNIMVVKLS